jgi:hypothetical protein
LPISGRFQGDIILQLLPLPASRSLKVAQKRSTELIDLLEYGYQQSRALLVVESEHYGVKSEKSDENWTLREWAGKFSERFPLQRFVFRPEFAAGSPNLPQGQPRLRSRTPEAAAQELRKLLMSSVVNNS